MLAAIDPEPALLGTTKPVPPMPLYAVSGMGTAALVIGLCLVGAEQMKRWGVHRVIAPAGRQTLTLYIVHILIGMGTLELLGLVGGHTVHMAVLASLLFCLVATLYALLWSRWFKRGPVETVMRAIAG